MSKRTRLAFGVAATALLVAAMAVGAVTGRRSLRAAWRALLHPELVEHREPVGAAPAQCSVLSEPSGELDDQIALDFQALDALSLDDPDSAALSGLTTTDLPVAVTRRTLRFVRFFAQDPVGRKAFRERQRRAGLYRSGVEQQLREAGLPEDLVWLAAIESSFDPQAVSPKGAAGMWQFMPETAALYGLDITPWLDERRSITRATEAAVTHLRDLYDRLGSWDLALAAYNMGYDGLLQAMQAYVDRRPPDKRDAGPPTFTDLVQARLLPHETADYVPKVAAFAIVAANLAKFDHDDVAPEEPLRLATLAVPEGTALRTIARAGGLAMSEIRQLNPQLLRDRIPPTGGDYLLTVPSERMEQARAALPAYLDHEVLEVEQSSALPAMPAPLVLGGSSDSDTPTPAPGMRRPPHLGPNRLPAFGLPGGANARGDALGLGPAMVTLDPALPAALTGIDIGWHGVTDPLSLLRGAAARSSGAGAQAEPELERQLAFLGVGKEPARHPAMNPFEEQRMPNGMLLRLRQDTEAPRVAITLQLIRPVGEATQVAASDGEIRYAELVSRRNLDVGLALAMGRLSVLLAETREGPIAAVRHELDQRRRKQLESEPYGRSWLELSRALFPGAGLEAGRVIGPEPPDGTDMAQRLVLAAMAEEQRPEQVTLTLVGDFDRAAAMVHLRHAMERLATGDGGAERPSGGGPRLVVRDRVQSPRALYGWLGPAFGSSEEVALEVAVQILGGSKESRFKRELIDHQFAATAKGTIDPGWPSTAVTFELTPTGPEPIESLERRVERLLDDFAGDGPSAAEVAFAKALVAYRLRKHVEQSAAPPSTDLAEATLGDRALQILRPGAWQHALDAVDKVTAATVRDVARRTLAREQRVEVVTLPEGQK